MYVLHTPPPMTPPIESGVVWSLLSSEQVYDEILRGIDGDRGKVWKMDISGGMVEHARPQL